MIVYARARASPRSFAATAATRSRLRRRGIDCVAYVVAATLVTAVMYAVPVHWVWSGGGFLRRGTRALLSTGATRARPVHMVGGVAARRSVRPAPGRFPSARSPRRARCG